MTRLDTLPGHQGGRIERQFLIRPPGMQEIYHGVVSLMTSVFKESDISS